MLHSSQWSHYSHLAVCDGWHHIEQAFHSDLCAPFFQRPLSSKVRGKIRLPVGFVQCVIFPSFKCYRVCFFQYFVYFPHWYIYTLWSQVTLHSSSTINLSNLQNKVETSHYLSLSNLWQNWTYIMFLSSPLPLPGSLCCSHWSVVFSLLAFLYMYNLL